MCFRTFSGKRTGLTLPLGQLLLKRIRDLLRLSSNH
jgi:hypothetical protein